MLFTLDDYMKHIPQTPDEFYRELNQATIDSVWNNTTQIRTIKEENFPFDNTYKECEAWVNTVADVTTNTDKVIGNYISVLFRNIDHPNNYRGQKYLYKTDNINEDYYLCYDKINPLTQTSNTKLIMCNNKLKWIDTKNGAIYEEPVFVGWELTSTNNQISKDGIVQERRLVCLIQGNKDTRGIKPNQRFIIGHNKAFKVTQIDDTNLEHINEEYPTLFILYIEWCSILPSDNLELNIADYYSGEYNVSVSPQVISQESGFEGKINATIKYNDLVVDLPLIWESSDESVVLVDNIGNYKLVGNPNNTATIKCYIKGNENSYGLSNVEIIEVVNITKELIINPNETVEIYQGDSQLFECGLYINGVKQSDLIECIPSWSNSKNYTISHYMGGYILNNLKYSTEPLYLTFKIQDITQTVKVILRALF